ncbi:class I SAM-dependent methyltransferase, partial [Candidatus Parcubacteria bacterium]|nr:class I SAM-dependent methyltransferase [Candidatus Parcubacteria bacterium]
MQELFYKIIYKTEQQNWWYRARRIIIKQLIKKYIQKIRPKILDVGCGTGLLFKELQQYADVYGIDSSPSSINFCVKRGLSNIKLGDATAIPHDDNFFDIVLALDLLEHIKDDNLAIQEIKRVVRKEGIIIIFVPAFKFLWGITDEISSHYRRYRKKDFVNLA